MDGFNYSKFSGEITLSYIFLKYLMRFNKAEVAVAALLPLFWRKLKCFT